MGIASDNATFCATLVDEWILLGLRAAFVAPGSRSTPLALALCEREELAVEVFHDERSASFAALGHGLATTLPAVLLCTSGTAATHFHGAVAEADASGVPLLVATSDRPPRLWGIGAPQTIRQQNLYGDAVRAFIEPGVPNINNAGDWRNIARQAWLSTLGGPSAPGPVQLNLSFEEPLVGQAQPIPTTLGFFEARSWPGAEDRDDGIDAAAAVVNGKRGVVIAGRGTTQPDAVIRLARQLRWPLIADHRSGCRQPGESVEHADSLFRIEGFANDIEVAVVFGEPLSSKVIGQWLGSGVEVVAAMPAGRWIDPQNSAKVVVRERGFAEELAGVAVPSPVDDRTDWLTKDQMAAGAVRQILGAPETTEPGVLSAVASESAVGSAIVVSSSMPVRDLEWFAPGRADVTTFANRGANGIDGVTSTAIGIALTGQPTTLVIGDVAFIHDTNALVNLRSRKLDLTIVVIDNNGGGIFSFLPQAEELSHDRYEQLFGTPHETDLAMLVSAHGLTAVDWDDRGSAITRPEGVQVLIARTDRRENVVLHEQLNAAIADAVARF